MQFDKLKLSIRAKSSTSDLSPGGTVDAINTGSKVNIIHCPISTIASCVHAIFRKNLLEVIE